MANLVEIKNYIGDKAFRTFINTEYVRDVNFNLDGSAAYVYMIGSDKYNYTISLADARKLIKAMGGSIQ